MTETKRNLPQPLDAYASAEAEVQGIRQFIPNKGVPVGERAKLNSVVRNRIASASDLAISILAPGHDLSRREFLRRMRDQSVQQMEAPLEYLLQTAGVFRRGEIQRLARDNAVRLAANSSPEKIVGFIERSKSSTMLIEDKVVYADILRSHPQKDEIVRRFLEQNGAIDWYVGWIEQVQKLAATASRSQSDTPYV